MAKALEVKNVRISFRTNNGTVKAVRDISFDLVKGETLAVVGESGSGKSVTARAIMGILAGNAIVEGGEIFYDGQDLLKISEESFQRLRGNRISMIFQDPLSALNPIVRIGKQLSEAMILNCQSNQKYARREFDEKIKALRQHTLAALPENECAAFEKELEIFKKVADASSKLEREYNSAKAVAVMLQSDMEGFAIDLLADPADKIAHEIISSVKNTAQLKNEFFCPDNSEGMAIAGEITSFAKTYAKIGDAGERSKLDAAVKKLGEYVSRLLSAEPIDFFDRVNQQTEGAGKEFLASFTDHLAMGVAHAFRECDNARAEVIDKIEALLPTLDDKDSLTASLKALKETVARSINGTAIQKDSVACTFESAADHALEAYLSAFKAKKGDTPDKARIDEKKENLRLVLTRLADAYRTGDYSLADAKDYAGRLIAYLREQSSAIVYKVTRGMAKARSIKLMEEVGISEPRKRYMQYPFEFSGGMRQRIVIAIALAANPDILICDEPTTALDVTIQAQILDLINGLKKERGLTVIFITHDLGVVANMADRIAVMYAGKIVEYGTADEIFYDPRHPYTWALLSSMPDLDTKEKLEAIPGTPPNMIFPPKGDAFAARNKYAMKIDFEEQPPAFPVSDTHWAATWLLHPSAPKAEPPKIVTDRIARMKALSKEADTNE